MFIENYKSVIPEIEIHFQCYSICVEKFLLKIVKLHLFTLCVNSLLLTIARIIVQDSSVRTFFDIQLVNTRTVEPKYI